MAALRLVRLAIECGPAGDVGTMGLEAIRVMKHLSDEERSAYVASVAWMAAGFANSSDPDRITQQAMSWEVLSDGR